MSAVTLERHVTATPDRVWAVLADLERWPEVLRDVERVERLDDGTGFGPGTRWRETRRVFRRSETQEMWITDADEPHCCVVGSGRGSVRYETRFDLVPEEHDGRPGTLVRVTFRGEAHTRAMRVLAAVTGAVAGRMVRGALARDLRDLGVAAEGPGSGS